MRNNFFFFIYTYTHRWREFKKFKTVHSSTTVGLVQCICMHMGLPPYRSGTPCSETLVLLPSPGYS